MQHCMMAGETCAIYKKKVLIHMYKIKCDICSSPVHKNCTLLTKNEYHDFIISGSPDWTCQNCVESIFPFNHIIDDNVFLGCLLELPYDYCLFYPDYVQPKIFYPFDLNDEKDHIPCSDIDPDSCYYNALSYTIQMNSNYYHEDSFNHF